MLKLSPMYMIMLTYARLSRCLSDLMHIASRMGYQEGSWEPRKLIVNYRLLSGGPIIL